MQPLRVIPIFVELRKEEVDARLHSLVELDCESGNLWVLSF